MSPAVKFHQFIDHGNVLYKGTAAVREYLRDHPALHKTALIVNHVFRAAAMVGLMHILPFPAVANGAICLTGSAFYRMTVEHNCAYKFALPAFAGAVAFDIGRIGLAHLVTGAALASLGAFALTLLSFVPLCAYVAYVILTVSYDVDWK